jgi:dTDP-4-amino-4,6-dideoxygalactose transaminase
MRLARHAPAGYPVPFAALLHAQRSGAAWPGLHEHYFDSGTAALGVAVKLAIAADSGGAQPRVALPAYGCPNLLASVLWAGGAPTYYDLSLDSLAAERATLAEFLAANDTIVLHVDAFGAPSLPDIGHSPRLVHDLAQSYLPYQSDWRPRALFNVLSFGRAKPLSLTTGGALLLQAEAQALMRSVDRYTEHSPSFAMMTCRAAIYGLSLQPLAFGLLSRIPQLRIGQTHFNALASVERFTGAWAVKIASGADALRNDMGNRIAHTARMLELARECGAIIPEIVLRCAGKAALWRVPVLCASAQHAQRLSVQGTHLGVSRLYGRTIPEIMGMAPGEAQERWPNATSLASRLVTLPTHGRLTSPAEAQLRRLLRQIQ